MFVKNILRTLSRQIIGVLIGLLISVIIARSLGPQGQGMYSLFILIPSILYTFLNLGIGSATVYFLNNGNRNYNAILKSNLYITKILVLTISIPYLLYIIMNFHNDSNANLYLHLLNILIFSLLILNDYSISVIMAKENFIKYNRVLLFKQLINLISCFILLMVFKLGILGAVISLILGMLYQQIYLSNFLREKSEEKVDFTYIKEAIRYGLKANLSNIFTFLNYRFSILIITATLNPYLLGIFVIAQTIGEKIWIPAQSIAAVLFPRLSKIQNSKEKIKFTIVLFYVSLAVTSVLSLIVYYTADIIFMLLYGNDFTSSSNIIKILLPGLIAFSGDKVLSTIFTGDGRPEVNLKAAIISFIVNILFSSILIVEYELIGIAIALNVTYFVSLLYKLFIFKKIYKVSFITLK